MFALTVALVVTTVLSLSFKSTQRIGLLTIAALSFLFPALAAVLLAIGAGVAAFLYFNLTWRFSNGLFRLPDLRRRQHK